MQLKIISAMLVGILLLLGIVLADYNCNPSQYPTVLTTSDVEVGKVFSFTAAITNLPQNTYIKGIIRDSNNFQLQTADGLYSDGKWSFSFKSISTPGAYAFEIQYNHPATGDSVSTRQAFLAKQNLVITLGISDYVQYANQDITLTMTVTPAVDTLKTFMATSKDVFGMTKDYPLNPIYTDKGGGVWELTIPANSLKEGTYDFTITLTDSKNTYSSTTKTIKDISVQKALIMLDVDYPLIAKCDDSKTITITALDGTSKPIDLDRLDLKITYAGGGLGKSYSIGDFVHTAGTGVYSLIILFTSGQQNYVEISAFVDDASTNKQFNIPVSGCESCACDKTADVCDTGCDCDSKCGGNGLSGWVIAVIVAIALLGLGFIIWVATRR